MKHMILIITALLLSSSYALRAMDEKEPTSNNKSMEYLADFVGLIVNQDASEKTSQNETSSTQEEVKKGLMKLKTDIKNHKQRFSELQSCTTYDQRDVVRTALRKIITQFNDTVNNYYCTYGQEIEKEEDIQDNKIIIDETNMQKVILSQSAFVCIKEPKVE